MIQYQYFKAIMKKEWIKLRLPFLLISGIQIMILFLYFLKIRHDIQLNGAVSVWYSLFFRDFSYFKFLSFLLMLSGGLLGFVQWKIETRKQCFRLSLRLPVSPTKMVLMMVGVGVILQICYCIFLAIILIGGCFIFFPRELISILVGPFVEGFIGGLALYFCISFLTLEPSWKRRIPLGFLLPGIIWFYGISVNSMGWSTAPISELIFTFLLPFFVFYSGLRYYYGLYQ